MNGIVSGKIEEKQSISDTIPTSINRKTIGTGNGSSPFDISKLRCIRTTISSHGCYEIYPQGKYIIYLPQPANWENRKIITDTVYTFYSPATSTSALYTVNFSTMTLTYVGTNEALFIYW
ncbi:MAG TPA: hypothetical protein DCW90_08590 [Lachnospiraceae bacterium]|nr:hypothetical protein [Lachnospiraceae bacterium]